MQWKHFIEAFNADRIYIWEVQLNTTEVLLVVTDKNIMPIVGNAMYVINIKAVSSERLPLLPKLIKLGVVNEETERLSILLFGISNYWRVLGCTHSENDFMNKRVVAVPTPDANPRLASKISSLFTDMVKLTKNRSMDSAIRSNICIRRLDLADMDNIHVPIPTTPVIGCHRWLMLSLVNDFSHIFVPAWKQFISYKRILFAIDHAKRSQKTIRMGPLNLKPQVYVPHNCDMKIFFGPMQKNETLNLQLLQQFEGKMVLREDYQRIIKQQPTALTFGTWLYMKDDMMVHANLPNTPDAQIRTYPPKLQYFSKSSTPTTQGFIPLKPSTITSNNMNITLMSPTTSEVFSNCTTSTPVTSSSGNVPSSELIRHLSLGLRARPTKIVNELNAHTSPIKVVDTKLLMSPQFITTSSSASTSTASTSSYLTKQGQSMFKSIQSKPKALSIQPNMQSNTDWKDISKGVPIRARRFTTIVSTDKPTLKSMLLQKPLIDQPNVTPNDSAVSKPIPSSIRKRRYTSISTCSKHLNIRPPINVKNFELVQNPGNKLTLAPISVTDASIPPLVLNRPVIIKKINAADGILVKKSETFNRSKTPLSWSNKQTNVKPPATSTIATKLSTAPIVVVKPSNFNLNLPKKLSAVRPSIVLGGKSVVLKKLPTLRVMPTNMKILGKNETLLRNNTTTTQFIHSDDDDASPRPLPPTRKQQTSTKTMPAETNNTIHGFIVSQVRGLGKIQAKKLFAAYSVRLLEGTKLFQTFEHCTDYLNE